MTNVYSVTRFGVSIGGIDGEVPCARGYGGGRDSAVEGFNVQKGVVQNDSRYPSVNVSFSWINGNFKILKWWYCTM